MPAIGGVFLMGFLGVSQPLGQRIDTANDRAAKAAARAMLAGDVANLRRQARLYQSKLPQGIDTNDWTNYILGFIRAQRVRLARIRPRGKAADAGVRTERPRPGDEPLDDGAV